MNPLRKPFQYCYYNAALYLIGINAIIFALQLISRGKITSYLALNPLNIIYNKTYWQFITYMFVHSTAGWTHILFNMLALFMFGPVVERYIGSKEFVLYYLVTGTFAGVASFFSFILLGQAPFLLGASGALFAVQLAYGAFFPHNIIYIWGIIPLRAPIMVILFTAIELFSGIFSLGGNTAHITHLFGFAAGFLYFIVRWGANPFKMMFGRGS